MPSRRDYEAPKTLFAQLRELHDYGTVSAKPMRKNNMITGALQGRGPTINVKMNGNSVYGWAQKKDLWDPYEMRDKIIDLPAYLVRQCIEWRE